MSTGKVKAFSQHDGCMEKHTKSSEVHGVSYELVDHVTFFVGESAGVVLTDPGGIDLDQTVHQIFAITCAPRAKIGIHEQNSGKRKRGKQTSQARPL